MRGTVGRGGLVPVTQIGREVVQRWQFHTSRRRVPAKVESEPGGIGIDLVVCGETGHRFEVTSASSVLRTVQE